MRTGQVHISRAFMCANTRLFYLSPNMSRLPAPLVLTTASSAPIPTKILTRAVLLRALQKCLRVPFLLPFWAYPCLRQPSSPIAGAGVDLTRQEIELIPKTSTPIYDDSASLVLLICHKTKIRSPIITAGSFLDAIASPSSYPCQ